MSETLDLKIKNDFQVRRPLFLVAAFAMFLGVVLGTITDVQLQANNAIILDVFSIVSIFTILVLGLLKVLNYNLGLNFLIYVGAANFIFAGFQYSIDPAAASQPYIVTSNLFIMMIFMGITGFILTKSSAIVFGLASLSIIIVNVIFKGDKPVLDNVPLWTMSIVAYSIILYYYRNSIEKLIKTMYRLHDRETELRVKATEGLEELKKAQSQIIAQEKLASLGSLTAGIAHEIKNPLNFVTNFSESSIELLSELNEHFDKVKDHFSEADQEDVGYLLTELTKNMKDIVHHGRRGDNIVKSMLMHSRTGTQAFTEEYFNALVEECLNLSYHGLRAKYEDFMVDLRVETKKDIPKIQLVRGDIARVLINLFSNAMYSTYQRARQKIDGYKATINVRTEETEKEVVLVIRDNGQGLSKEVKAKLFQPFFTTKPTGEGTGLGLSMAFDIVTKLHKGQITVEGEPNSFAEFRILIPKLG